MSNYRTAKIFQITSNLILLAVIASLFTVATYAIFFYAIPYLYDNHFYELTVGEYTAFDLFLDGLEIGSFIGMIFLFYKAFRSISAAIEPIVATRLLADFLSSKGLGENFAYSVSLRLANTHKGAMGYSISDIERAIKNEAEYEASFLLKLSDCATQ